MSSAFQGASARVALSTKRRKQSIFNPPKRPAVCYSPTLLRTLLTLSSSRRKLRHLHLHFEASITALSTLIFDFTQQKTTKAHRVCSQTIPAQMSRADTPQPESCSHGKPSSSDSGQEPFFGLLHPYRWRTDAVDALSPYPTNPDSRCASARVHSWR